jgi:exopolyphosphatase/guanosine-5'-triphosphate,3'-diphosphate pyrophosphatase
MVRLGAGGLDGRALTPRAIQAAMQTLSKFRRLAESHQVEHIEAVATSAVREAENGGEFLKAITTETGIRARVISGTEEARLIHLAAAYGLGLRGEVGVTIDIGGGSVEITHGTGASLAAGRSFKVGVIRLTERFVKSDPISARDERKLVRHIDSELKDYLQEIADAGFDRVIGTSGSILSVGTIAAAEEDGEAPSAIRNRRVSAKQMHRVRKLLCSIGLQKRLVVPGLEPRRADIAVAGAILIDTILRRLGAHDITLCDMSLREGIILDYIAQHRKEIAQAERYPDVRRRSVIELAERCNYVPGHANQIVRLSLALFDATRGSHALTDREREWLEYAALLHDVGVHISYERHHKHSYYLIRNGDLRGFEPLDVETIALIARYHRRAVPAGGHKEYAELPRKRRTIVRTLSAILRLAESLDRSHSQIVSSITLHDRGDDALLQLKTTGDAELELWAASRHLAPFERVIGKPLRIEPILQAAAAQSGHSPAAVETVRQAGDGKGTTAVAADSSGNTVRGRRTAAGDHLMELVRGRYGRHAQQDAEEPAEAADARPGPRARSGIGGTLGARRGR